MGVGKRLGRAMVATGLTLGFVGAAVGVGGSAEAANLPLSCSAVGEARHTVDTTTGVATWTIVGQGDCDGDWRGPYYLDFTGTGTSQGLGSCTGDIDAENLTLHVTGTLRSTASGTVRAIDETWTQAHATFPGPAAFTIGGTEPGFGVLTTRIFGKCPPEGTVSTRYAFSLLG